MPRLMIELPKDVGVQLHALAQDQRRTPKAQAEWLLIEALQTWAAGDRSPAPASQQVSVPTIQDHIPSEDAHG